MLLRTLSLVALFFVLSPGLFAAEEGGLAEEPPLSEASAVASGHDDGSGGGRLNGREAVLDSLQNLQKELYGIKDKKSAIRILKVIEEVIRSVTVGCGEEFSRDVRTDLEFLSSTDDEAGAEFVQTGKEKWSHIVDELTAEVKKADDSAFSSPGKEVAPSVPSAADLLESGGDGADEESFDREGGPVDVV
jgi:hypothetical protein